MKVTAGENKFSVAILGQETLSAMEEEGTVLSSALLSNNWQLRKPKSWKGRQIGYKKSRKRLLALKNVVRSPVRKLFEAYVTHLKLAPTSMFKCAEQEETLKPCSWHVASAFVLAGVGKMEKGAKECNITSKTKEINKRTIDAIDHYVNCNPVRLTYEFLAKNKKLPKGYIAEVLKPYFMNYLAENGIDADIIESIVEDQFNKCGITNETNISLESMMELKNRLRTFCIRERVYIPAEKMKESIPKDHKKPELTSPKPKSGYQCDEDDLWLIQHTVENAKSVRVAGDLAKRIMRWAKRNKRGGMLAASGLALELLIAGLSTGGLGTAVAGVVSVGLTVSLFLLDKSIMQIRSLFMRKKLHKIQGGVKEDKMDDFLDSCGYLTSKKGVSRIFNAYANLENSAQAVKDEQLSKKVGVKKEVSLQKKKALVRLRHQQLQKCFGMAGSDDNKDIESYDRLMLETVKEISRLNDEFEKDFDQLWKPFEQMDADERWRIFNQAANQKVVKNRGLKRTQKHHQWIKDTVKEGGGKLSNKLKSAFDQLPTTDKSQLISLSKFHNWNVENMAATCSLAAKTVYSFLIAVGKSALGSVLEFPKFIRSGKLPVIKDFFPRDWGPFVVVWAFYYFGEKISCLMNRVANQCRVGDMHASLQDVRFDQGSPLKREDWNAIRREAKDSMKDFVDLLKQLRKEHVEIKEMLKQEKGVDENQRNVTYASALLRRKMLEQQINTLLSGAIGHMHEETVRSAWHQHEFMPAVKVG